MKNKEISSIIDNVPEFKGKDKVIEYILDLENKNQQLAAMVAHMAQDISKLSLEIGGTE